MTKKDDFLTFKAKKLAIREVGSKKNFFFFWIYTKFWNFQKNVWSKNVF